MRARNNIFGFSVIELMVSIAVLAIIAVIAIPDISAWIGKAKVRASAEALQNNIRFAQGEAMKRNKFIEFSLINSSTTPVANPGGFNNDTAADDGVAWVVRMINDPSDATAGRTFLQGDVFSHSGITLSGGGNATLVFGGIGEVYTAFPTGSGPVLPSTRAYRITSFGSKYPLCVLVTPGGGVRWCDPFIPSGDRSCPGSATNSCL